MKVFFSDVELSLVINNINVIHKDNIQKKNTKTIDYNNELIPSFNYRLFALNSNELIQKIHCYFTLLKYGNGLAQNIEKPYTIGIYSRNNVFSQKVLLFSSVFKTLDLTIYVDRDVIDACCIVNERNWNNTTFVPTQQTFYSMKVEN